MKYETIKVPKRPKTDVATDRILDVIINDMTGYEVFDLLAIEYDYDRLFREIAHFKADEINAIKAIEKSGNDNAEYKIRKSSINTAIRISEGSANEKIS